MAVWVTYSIHWYCLKGAEVKHLLLTTCTYYIIAILVDIAKRTTADSAKHVSNAKYSRKKVGGPGLTLATLLVHTVSDHALENRRASFLDYKYTHSIIPWVPRSGLFNTTLLFSCCCCFRHIYATLALCGFLRKS